MEDKKPKILLISAQDNLSAIGLNTLHSILLEHSYQSFLLHLPYFKPGNAAAFSTLLDFVKDLKPAFIGLSVMSIEYLSACEISRFLKEHFPLIPIIGGGVQPTTSPETCFPYADYVCVGEGGHRRPMLSHDVPCCPIDQNPFRW